MLSADEYVAGVRRGDRVVLGRAITLVESARPEHQELAAEVLDRCMPETGHGVRIGVTGVPGVGKSTFVEAFGKLLTGRGHRVAVLAVDPSSRRTHGSILGDKTRMERLATDPAAFIRPSPTGGSLGGVARATREAGLLCEAAGYDVVVVETVGVGQSETAVHAMVDFFLLLVLTGAGDELQGMKRGILEMADAVAVTKADGDNAGPAQRTRTQYQRALALFPPHASGWRPRVHACSAVTGRGIGQIRETIDEFTRTTRENGSFDRRRRDQARRWMQDLVEQHLRTRFFESPAVRAVLPGIEADVAAGRRSARGAAQELLRRASD